MVKKRADVHRHYELSPTHRPGEIWVALVTPSREGVIGGVTKARGGKWRTIVAAGLGVAGGPYGSKDEAVRALIDVYLDGGKR